MSEPLVMWTIYDHPSDWPDWIVARAWYCDKGPEPVPGDRLLMNKDIDKMRALMVDMGLVCLGRNEGDDPAVVETWI